MDLHKAARDPWVWGQFVLIGLVALLAPLLPRFVNMGDLDYTFNRIDPDWIRWLGGVLAAGGVGLAVWGMRSLGPSLTPGTEPLPDAPLVTGGAYAYVRHPIYGGVVLMLAGYALAWSNWMLALILGFAALQYFDAKARAEERWLMERYPEYQRYAVRVRRRVL
ncbi:MAG: isoprenylcysteine carboxylmethyltransferase family protein [Gemmatimonadales bacterium]